MEYLAHYGVAGQKWGRRRYQNDDGSLTGVYTSGRVAYRKDVVDKEWD